MKRIQTSESVVLLRLTLIVCALVATVGVRSGIAATTEPKEAKLTELMSKELTNLPGRKV